MSASAGQPRVPEAAPTRLGADEAEAVRAAIEGVVSDGPWIGGPAVAAFEEEFAVYLGARHVVGCASGTDALVLALGALNLPAGSTVLVPANDGGYAAIAARLGGFEPVAVDLDPQRLVPTVETLAAGWRADARAVIVTHLHGDPLDLADIAAWCEERGLALIEDCAQAHGARRDGHHVGLVGDAATFSFYPTKNLGAVGDAGAVVTRDPDLAQRVRALAQYGWQPRPVMALPGGRNSRLDPIQAAVLSARLRFLDARNERRREIVARYRHAAPALRILGEARVTVAHHAVVETDDRAGLEGHLRDAGVATAIHYPLVVGEMPGLRLAADARSTPVAQRLARRILSVPCAPELTDDEVQRVAQALADWVEVSQ